MMIRYAVVCSFLSLWATSALADCRTKLSAVVAAEKAAGPYRSNMHETQGRSESQSVMQVVPPAAYHLKTGADEQIETSQGYWAKENGKWTKERDGGGSYMLEHVKTGLVGDLSKLTALDCGKQETRDGKTFAVFDYQLREVVSGITVTKKIRLLADEQMRPTVTETDITLGKNHNRIVRQIVFDPQIKVEPPK